MQWNETGCEKTYEQRHRGDDYQAKVQRRRCSDSVYPDDSDGLAIRVQTAAIPRESGLRDDHQQIARTVV